MASIELKQRSKLTGKDNYGTWRISTEMALNKLKAWRAINEEAPVTPDSYKNDAALDAACKEWLLETFEEEEVTGQKVISNRKKFNVVNLLRGLGRPFQSWAREVRHMDLNNLDFDTLCSEAFNEEQSTKRGEEESNTNRGSALSTKKEKGSQNRSQQDSEENGGAPKRWRCQTHKTNDHAWYDCPENPKNRNKGEDTDKKKAGAKDYLEWQYHQRAYSQRRYTGRR